MKIDDPLVKFLKRIVNYGVKFLAVLMTLVILWSVLDVVVALYDQLMAEPFMRFGPEHLFSIFGSFLTVLVGIEIFLNVIIYLTKEMFHVQLVVATALTAVIRKLIVLEYSVVNAPIVYAIAALVFAVAVAFWIVTQNKDVNAKSDARIV
jgi:uncharacterized membrane protein (DUF373 family)